MIDLNPTDLEIVKRILAEHVPGCEVRAFGSRVTWTAKEYSDLDLAIVCDKPLDLNTLGNLREAFEESDLPIRVDVLDWQSTAESFRKVIERRFERLQDRPTTGVAIGRPPRIQLRDLSIRITKGTTPTTMGRPFVERGVNFVKSDAITDDGRIDPTSFAFIDENTHAALARSILEIDDVLFSMAGVYLGKTAVVSASILPATTNQAVAIIRVDRQKAMPKFIGGRAAAQAAR